jgi:hypothetical protein
VGTIAVLAVVAVTLATIDVGHLDPSLRTSLIADPPTGDSTLHEGNYSITAMLGGARAQEKAGGARSRGVRNIRG